MRLIRKLEQEHQDDVPGRVVFRVRSDGGWKLVVAKRKGMYDGHVLDPIGRVAVSTHYHSDPEEASEAAVMEFVATSANLRQGAMLRGLARERWERKPRQKV